MSLEEVKARLQEASDTKEGLLAQIYKIYVEESSSEEKFLSEALSKFHNSGEIDLVDAVKRTDNNSDEYDCFTILHAFAETLTLMDAKVEDVIYSLVQLMQHSNTSGKIYRYFEQFCRMEEQRPSDSIRFILAQSELCKYATFLSSAIRSYGAESLAEALQTTETLLADRHPTVRNEAYFALAELGVKEGQASIIWEHFLRSVDRERDTRCRASILSAVLNFGQKSPSYWSKIEDFLFEFTKKDDPELIHAISNSIVSIDLPENALHILVKKLANVSPERKDTISNIQCLLVKLVKRGSSSVAVELLESILGRGVNFTSLSYFSRELLYKHTESLNHLITKWFLSDKPLLCNCILELLSNEGDRHIKLEADMTLLRSDNKQLFVSRKAVGWLYTRPILAASFILSIYQMASANTRKELEEVLYDPLLLSYPGELKRFLQQRIDKDVKANLCERLLERLQAYHADIEKVSGIKELMAPSENVNLYWKEFNKGIQKAHDEASKSSLMNLFTTQRLLYGNSSIYYLHRGDGDQIRQEMEMQSYSHSTEMPRLNVLDPETLDYTLQVYSYEVMKNEVDS